MQQRVSKHSPAMVPNLNLSHFHFQMYDASCTKTLCHDDVKTLTKALHDLQGKPLSESELGDKVKSIFNQCDLNKDGKISQDEFLKAGVAISEMFELEGDD